MIVSLYVIPLHLLFGLIKNEFDHASFWKIYLLFILFLWPFSSKYVLMDYWSKIMKLLLLDNIHLRNLLYALSSTTIVNEFLLYVDVLP